MRLVLVVASACCLLAACGVAPQRVETPAKSGPIGAESEAARPQSQPAPSPAPSTGAGRPGGYYKDDGPGDNPPPGLAELPDAEPRIEPLHRFANEPYSALGQNYTPAKELAPFRQRGLASWYGRMFHGRKTSSGEIYDMYAMTAAHPTLPIPSYVRVTNLGNGNSVVVRVNDRGPFHPGRVIDLSYAAALRLGYVSKGHTQVEVEAVVPDAAAVAAARAPAPQARTARTVAPANAAQAAAGREPMQAVPPEDPIAALDRPRDATAAAGGGGDAAPGIFVQVAAFRTSDKAQGLRERLRREIAGIAERLMIEARDGMFRLHVGPYGSLDDAQAIAARIGEAFGLRPLIIRRGL